MFEKWNYSFLGEEIDQWQEEGKNADCDTERRNLAVVIDIFGTMVLIVWIDNKSYADETKQKFAETNKAVGFTRVRSFCNGNRSGVFQPEVNVNKEKGGCQVEESYDNQEVVAASNEVLVAVDLSVSHEGNKVARYWFWGMVLAWHFYQIQ